MSFDPKAPAVSKTALWAGRIVSAIPVLMLLFSATMKFIASQQRTEGFQHLGWDESLAIPLGVVEISCTILYLYPRTAVLGAVLLTGYLGGAIATHVRIDEAFFIQFGLGVLVWLGLYLRDLRVRTLVPWRK